VQYCGKINAKHSNCKPSKMGDQEIGRRLYNSRDNKWAFLPALLRASNGRLIPESFPNKEVNGMTMNVIVKITTRDVKGEKKRAKNDANV
jgi:hypothetical protein